MEITDKARYVTTVWTVEHNGREFSVRCSENITHDTWEVEEYNDMDISDELREELIEFCCDEMSGRVENKG